MRKRVSVIAMLIGILIMVSGCRMGNKPETTVSEFIEAMKELDIEEMSSKMNAGNIEDKEDASLFLEGDQDDPMEQYLVEYLGANAKEISYKINEAEIDGESAVVKVDFEYINAGPLFQNTFAEFMKQSLALLFGDHQPTDEESAEFFVEIMKEQGEIIDQPRVDESIAFKCIQRDQEWYIEEIDDQVLNIMMSNILSVLEGVGGAMGFDDMDEEDEMKEDANIIEVASGEEVELATIKIKVNGSEEVQTIPSQYSDDLGAKEGTKFLLVNMDLTNITKSEINAPTTLLLVDSQEREFNSYDSIGVVDDYLEHRSLAPSIKETGTYMYELPEDASNYYLIVKHAETEDLYQIYLD